MLTASGYQLQLATDAAFTTDLTSYAINNGTTKSLVVPGATIAGTYFWRVNVNLGSGLVISPFYRTFTTPAVAPLAPTLIAPTPAYVSGSKIVVLNWSNVNDLVGREMIYQIQVDNTATFALPEYAAPSVSGISITTTPLANGTYYWRVRVIISSSSTKLGAWSALRIFKVAT